MIVNEPTLEDGSMFFGSMVLNDLVDFKARSNLVLANRWNEELADIARKVYTRDLYKRD